MKKIISILAAVAGLAVSTVQAGVYTNATGGWGLASRDAKHTYTIGADLDTSERAYAATDTVILCNIPSNAWVSQVFAQVVTGSVALGTIDVGDNNSATQYLSNVNVSNATVTASDIVNGRLFATNGWVGARLDHATTNAIIHFGIQVIDYQSTTQ